jgi:superfamily II DNA or RNA helicase
MESAPLTLSYDRGSLVLAGAAPATAPAPEGVWVWDPRIGAHRALALHYRAAVRALTQAGRACEDRARDYADLPPLPDPAPAPHPHQAQALAAWERGKRGVVELPTGAGKTRLALMALARVRRAALILVPTLDLVTQWAEALRTFLGIDAGLVGGGSFDVRPVTVCTYASACRHGERFGNRFGLAVFDECHHLAGEMYARCAEVLIAPYRLGLTATLERPDGRHALLEGLIGPVVYRQAIGALSGRYLAHYRTEVLEAELNAEEREQYLAARRVYRDFVAAQGLRLAGPGDWQRFVYIAAGSPQGREALAGYYRQKRLTFASAGKFALLADLLHRHRGQQTLVFTNDNRTAYEVSRRFLVPLITHQTRVQERREILARFRDGRWPILATSKVLNEGVDVPAASVAVIVSGNASVREHVQRLGRILRKDGDKQAVLYELLTRGTSEQGTSERRRQHDAYR